MSWYLQRWWWWLLDGTWFYIQLYKWILYWRCSFKILNKNYNTKIVKIFLLVCVKQKRSYWTSWTSQNYIALEQQKRERVCNIMLGFTICNRAASECVTIIKVYTAEKDTKWNSRRSCCYLFLSSSDHKTSVWDAWERGRKKVRAK